jgi:hypothetical protein
MPPNIDNAERHFHETKRKGVAMAGEPVTEREAILEARIKELEEEAHEQTVSVAKGGVFESTWRTINAIVPTWLAGVALAMFLAHHGFVYYMQAQTIEAETELKAAKADVETANANALNGKIGAVPMRLATLRAELANKQAEAARARAEAQAQSALVNGETTRLATLKAQLANAQNQAALARAKADAEGAKFGLRTLEDRAVRAKLILQQLKIIGNRAEAAEQRAIRNSGGDLKKMYPVMARAFCEDNQFAELISCPAQYIRQKANSPALQETRSEPSPDAPQPARALPYNARVNGQYDLTLRSCPQSSCGDLGHLPKGLELVVVADAGGGWLKVRALRSAGGFVFGFVNGKFLNAY